jgi:hypothetical protein
MRSTLLLLAAACCTIRDRNSSCEFSLRGALAATTRGSAEAGSGGTAQEPYYTISLGGAEGAAAAVFIRAGSAPPPVGTYQMGEEEFGTGGFSGLIIMGMPAHPTGVFRVKSGTLTVTAATPVQLTGRFELRAVGFLTKSPADDTQSVTVNGTFTARARGGTNRSSIVPHPSPGGPDS